MTTAVDIDGAKIFNLSEDGGSEMLIGIIRK